MSDKRQVWTDQMIEGKSKTHLSGTLHWLTLSKTFTVINHKVTPLRCMQHWYMNVNRAGHLLVLTHCTTGKHSKQLHVYDQHQQVLCQVKLPHVMQYPFSVMTSARDTFVVVGWHGVWWIDRQGHVLRQYGGELSWTAHITQHSKGPLLIADWEKHRLVVLSNEATLLQHLSDVEYPLTLHLNEQAGLLFVEQWKDENNADVKVFQLCLKITRKLCLQDEG